MDEFEELMLLLDKVTASEDLVRRAELYLERNRHRWSLGVEAYFRDFLERKKDQIHYEWHRVNAMGTAIALDRWSSPPDI